MEQTRKTYLAWLRDAHALEEQALRMMQGMIGRLGPAPRLRARVETHIGETREQLAALRRLMARRGAHPAAGREDEGGEAAGTASALAQSLSGVFAGDAVVQGALAS